MFCTNNCLTNVQGTFKEPFLVCWVGLCFFFSSDFLKLTDGWTESDTNYSIITLSCCVINLLSVCMLNHMAEMINLDQVFLCVFNIEDASFFFQAAVLKSLVSALKYKHLNNNKKPPLKLHTTGIM